MSNRGGERWLNHFGCIGSSVVVGFPPSKVINLKRFRGIRSARDTSIYPSSPTGFSVMDDLRDGMMNNGTLGAPPRWMKSSSVNYSTSSGGCKPGGTSERPLLHWPQHHLFCLYSLIVFQLHHVASLPEGNDILDFRGIVVSIWHSSSPASSGIVSCCQNYLVRRKIGVVTRAHSSVLFVQNTRKVYHEWIFQLSSLILQSTWR